MVFTKNMVYRNGTHAGDGSLADYFRKLEKAEKAVRFQFPLPGYDEIYGNGPDPWIFHYRACTVSFHEAVEVDDPEPDHFLYLTIAGEREMVMCLFAELDGIVSPIDVKKS